MNLIAGMAGHRYAPAFARMSILPIAPASADKLAAVVFDALDQVPYLHASRFLSDRRIKAFSSCVPNRIIFIAASNCGVIARRSSPSLIVPHIRQELERNPWFEHSPAATWSQPTFVQLSQR
jgi:hypothetical protein